MIGLWCWDRVHYYVTALCPKSRWVFVDLWPPKSLILHPFHWTNVGLIYSTWFPGSCSWVVKLFSNTAVSSAFLKASEERGRAPVQSGPPHFCSPWLSWHKAPPQAAVAHGWSPGTPQICNREYAYVRTPLRAWDTLLREGRCLTSYEHWI